MGAKVGWAHGQAGKRLSLRRLAFVLIAAVARKGACIFCTRGNFYRVRCTRRPEDWRRVVLRDVGSGGEILRDVGLRWACDDSPGVGQASKR
jgi:hypothetical protein